MRGTVLSLREKEFIESSRVLGNSELYTMWRHVLPNCIAPLTVLATSMFGWSSWPRARCPSWAWACRRPRRPGATCWPPQAFMAQASYLSIFPGLSIALALLGINLLATRCGTVSIRA